MNDPTGLPATEGDSAKAAPTTTLLPDALAPDAGGQGPATWEDARLAIADLFGAWAGRYVADGDEAQAFQAARCAAHMARQVLAEDEAVADAGQIGRL